MPRNVDTYFRAMFASMQARRLGDAMYYWENLKKSGIIPDVSLEGLGLTLNPSRPETDLCIDYRGTTFGLIGP